MTQKQTKPNQIDYLGSWNIEISTKTVCQTASSLTHTVTTEKGEEGTFRVAVIIAE